MVRRIEYNFMYKHGTYILYLRVKNKKQLEREGEREKKSWSHKSLFLQNSAQNKQINRNKNMKIIFSQSLLYFPMHPLVDTTRVLADMLLVQM